VITHAERIKVRKRRSGNIDGIWPDLTADEGTETFLPVLRMRNTSVTPSEKRAPTFKGGKGRAIRELSRFCSESADAPPVFNRVQNGYVESKKELTRPTQPKAQIAGLSVRKLVRRIEMLELSNDTRTFCRRPNGKSCAVEDEGGGRSARCGAEPARGQ